MDEITCIDCGKPHGPFQQTPDGWLCEHCLAPLLARLAPLEVAA